MNCDYRQKISLYADDELGPAEYQQVSEHLRSCDECSAALLELLEMKKSLRIAGNRYTAPPDLRASVQRIVHTPAPRSAFWKWGLAMACVLALVVAGLIFRSRPQQDTLVAELVDQHITTLASEHPVDVISNDTHTVKPWFQGKLPFTFNPPDLTGSSYNLIGAKLIYAHQTPGAELLCQAGRHRISIFIFQAAGKEDRRPKMSHNHSFTVSDWIEGGRQFYLVTDASSEEAGHLSTLFWEANKA
jgi:anti-sigma factor RsiW